MVDGAVGLNFRLLEGGGLIERSIADGESLSSWCFECEVMGNASVMTSPHQGIEECDQ